MKAFGQWLILPVLLSLLVACGKENESGKTSKKKWDYNNPYNGNPYSTPYSTVNSPYSYGGVAVNAVMQNSVCSGYQWNQRIPISIPLVGFPSTIANGDTYVGVTSYGDVAALVGRGGGQAPLFVGYMCPRSFAPQGQGQLMGIKIGAYTKCIFKPISAATIVFPGGATAEFRMLDFGRGMNGGPYPFCTN